MIHDTAGLKSVNTCLIPFMTNSGSCCRASSCCSLRKSDMPARVCLGSRWHGDRAVAVAVEGRDLLMRVKKCLRSSKQSQIADESGSQGEPRYATLLNYTAPHVRIEWLSELRKSELASDHASRLSWSQASRCRRVLTAANENKLG